MSDITKILTQRGKTYGNFLGQAAITKRLKDEMRGTIGWKRLPPDMQEALEMLAVKCARILNGDPYYLDNWQDIAGYAQLVADRLKGSKK